MSSAEKGTVYYYRQIMDSLKKGQVDPAYFIYGDETYLIDSLVEQIGVKFLGSVEKEINYFLRYAPDHSLDDLLALTAGSGLFSAKKVIVYKDFQNLRNPNMDKLLKYLQRPDPNICLILIARIDSISQVKYRSLQQATRCVNVLPLRAAELEEFVKQQFAEHRKTAASEGIQTLLYLVGDKMHDLRTEVAQVANYYKDKAVITPEDIEAIVGVYVTQDVFELTRLIARKQLEKSLFVLHNLLEKGENPTSILFLLLRHIIMLWKIRGYHQSGIKDTRKIQAGLKLYPRQLNEYLQELPGWKPAHLSEAVRLIQESDRVLKSSQMSPVVVLDTLVLKLINLS